MVVTVYARHSTNCRQSKVSNSGQYRRCKCPLWLRWGKSRKRSARTRSWEIATKAARKLEEELEREALGIEVPEKPNHVTIDAALELYRLDRAQRGIKDSSKAQRLLGRLRDYAYSRSVVLLKDVSARMLTEWRATWTFNKDSSGPAVAWSVVKTFFRWADSIDLIPSDSSCKLKSLPIVRKQVQPLTRAEMEALLAATSQCGFTAAIEARVRIFILLQRWSGLACVDAATLPRNLLRADDNLTQVHRTNKAGVKHGQQEMLSHRFRHTFAVELLSAGTRIEQVSKLLGHKTVRTTERYYSAWVKERQLKLEADVKLAWTQMELPALPLSLEQEVAPDAIGLSNTFVPGMIQ